MTFSDTVRALTQSGRTEPPSASASLPALGPPKNPTDCKAAGGTFRADKFGIMQCMDLPTAQQIQAQQIQEQQAQAAATQVAVQAQKPACLPKASWNTAQTLCAQKRAGAGAEAVAAFGAVLGSDDPYAPFIAQAPCDWALIPMCAQAAPPPKASLHPTATKTQVPPTARGPVAPSAPAPKSDTLLIVGGVAAGALVLAGVFYALKRRAA